MKIFAVKLRKTIKAFCAANYDGVTAIATATGGAATAARRHPGHGEEGGRGGGTVWGN